MNAVSAPITFVQTGLAALPVQKSLPLQEMKMLNWQWRKGACIRDGNESSVMSLWDHPGRSRE